MASGHSGEKLWARSDHHDSLGHSSWEYQRQEHVDAVRWGVFAVKQVFSVSMPGLRARFCVSLALGHHHSGPHQLRSLPKQVRDQTLPWPILCERTKRICNHMLRQKTPRARDPAEKAIYPHPCGIAYRIERHLARRPPGFRSLSKDGFHASWREKASAYSAQQSACKKLLCRLAPPLHSTLGSRPDSPSHLQGTLSPSAIRLSSSPLRGQHSKIPTPLLVQAHWWNTNFACQTPTVPGLMAHGDDIPQVFRKGASTRIFPPAQASPRLRAKREMLVALAL